MKNLNYAFISSYIMTITIFGKKLLLIATITVLVTGLTLAATFNDAEAKKPKGPKIGTFDIKCKSSGTFMGGAEALPLGAATVVSATGNCNAGLGTVSSVGILESDDSIPTKSDPIGFPDVFNCFGFESATAAGDTKPSPSIIFNKKGDSILFEVKDGVQCFFGPDGTTPKDPRVVGFCPAGAVFSESTASFDVIFEADVSRFQSTGAFDDATGSGTITSEASHCDRSFPLANWSISTLEGTITVP